MEQMAIATITSERRLKAIEKTIYPSRGSNDTSEFSRHVRDFARGQSVDVDDLIDEIQDSRSSSCSPKPRRPSKGESDNGFPVVSLRGLASHMNESRGESVRSYEEGRTHIHFPDFPGVPPSPTILSPEGQRGDFVNPTPDGVHERYSSSQKQPWTGPYESVIHDDNVQIREYMRPLHSQISSENDSGVSGG